MEVEMMVLVVKMGGDGGVGSCGRSVEEER